MPLTLPRERIEDQVTQYVYPRPITFDEWLETDERDTLTDLVNGTPVEQPRVQREHEKLSLWLLHVLDLYAKRAGIGTVLGTRFPVRISQFGGRLPDLFFVQRDRENLIMPKATLGPPDMRLPKQPPHRHQRYRIDQPRRRVRILHRTEAGYDAQTLSGQPLTLRALGGLPDV